MWGGVQSDNRRSVQSSMWVNAARGDEGRSFRESVSPQLDVRVSSRFSTTIGMGYSRNGNDWQFYGRNGAIGSDTTHYTFARLDHTTLSLNTRLNFTATPNLSFQFYAEPFVSNGTYADRKEIRDARADSYPNRFKSYGSGSGVFDGFNDRQFNSNAVLRYEYRPGSSLFMVWQQGRNRFLTPADAEYQVGRDYGAALRDHPNNTFLIKLSYWMNP